MQLWGGNVGAGSGLQDSGTHDSVSGAGIVRISSH